MEIMNKLKEKRQVWIIVSLTLILFAATYLMPEYIMGTVAMFLVIGGMLAILIWLMNRIDKLRTVRAKETIIYMTCLTELFANMKPRDYVFVKRYHDGEYWYRLENLKEKFPGMPGTGLLWMWYVLYCDHAIQIHYLRKAMRRYDPNEGLGD